MLYCHRIINLQEIGDTNCNTLQEHQWILTIVTVSKVYDFGYIMNKSIEDNYKEYTKKLILKMKFIEAIIQKKVDVAELQKLKKKVEENENKIKELMENNIVEEKNLYRYHGSTREGNSRSYREVTEGKR